MKKKIAVLSLFCGLALATTGHAATARIVDSTQMDLRAINAVSGVPVVSVGLIMAWGSDNPPQDPEKWLECDGRAFSAVTYPDLANIYPSLRVPDYQNQFLRGGGTGQVGQVAADSMKSHAHQMDQHQHTVSGSSGAHSYNAPAPGGGGQYLYTLKNTTEDTYLSTPGFLSTSSCLEYSSYMRDCSGENRPGVGVRGLPVGGGGSVSASTSGGSISGFTNTAGPTSTKSTGGAETAPQHIRVRYLIRVLP